MYYIKLSIVDNETKDLNSDFITVRIPYTAITKITLNTLINSLFLLLRRNNEYLQLENLYNTTLLDDPF